VRFHFQSNMLRLAILLVLASISLSSSLNDHRIKKRFNWREESDLYWSENCDWSGNDLSSAKIQGEQCGSQCLRTSGCTHFTWTGYNGGTCWMKQNPTSLDRAISHGSEYSVCGIMKKSAPPSGGVKVKTINKCSFTVWVGAFGKQSTPEKGGWRLNPGESKTVDIAVNGQWNGRFWGRTDCDSNGRCSSGQCKALQCDGTTGQTPATLAEITFNGAGGLDFYDVSLVDGYNLPIKMRPMAGSFTKGNGGKYDCAEAGCVSDLNGICPKELAVKANNRVVGCKSACEAFNTDAYCCRGAHNVPKTCPPSDYSRIFKKACPDAYSYAYDDQTSTYTCRGKSGSGASYEVQFC